jgi:hypothetical protein
MKEKLSFYAYYLPHFSTEQIVECFAHAGVREDEIAQESVVLAPSSSPFATVLITSLASGAKSVQPNILLVVLSMMALSRPSVFAQSLGTRYRHHGQLLDHHVESLLAGIVFVDSDACQRRGR